jgi:hypothetical protein
MPTGKSTTENTYHLTLADAPKLENQPTSGGRLAGIDVPADNDRNMLLSGSHYE